MSFWDIMPYWWKAKKLRPAPNPTLRGSLFGLVRRGDKTMLHDFVVYNDKNLSITYSGPSLGQADFDVWLYILQVSGQRFLDPEVNELTLEFSISGFLNEIGRKGSRSGTRNKDWLIDRLTRLTGSTITVRTPNNNKGIVGTLLQGAAWDADKNKLVIKVNAQIGYLFSAQVTLLSVDIRARLIGDDLSLWLYNFIASNRNNALPLTYGIETIMERCRTQIKNKRVFKIRLAEKMERIMEAESTIDQAQRDFYNYTIHADNLIVFYTQYQRERWDESHSLQL